MFYSSSISIITDCAATKIQSYGFVLGEGEALFAQCGYSLSICANFRRHKSISFFIQNANISFSICSQHALAQQSKMLQTLLLQAWRREKADFSRVHY